MSSASTAQADLEEREAAASEVARELLNELSGELRQALRWDSPAEAINICRNIAPALANEYSHRYGWEVARVGTRARNTLLGRPDRWEREVLDRFEARHEEGESYTHMSHGSVVEVGDRRYYRYMKAIPMQSQCMTCHGTSATIPAEVSQALDTHYPFDKATGYSLDELRGAVSITQPLDQALPR